MGIYVSNENSLGEGDLAACTVNGNAVLVDQVEHVGNLCAVPGHLGNGEYLLTLGTQMVGVVQGCVNVGRICTCLDLIGSLNTT